LTPSGFFWLPRWPKVAATTQTAWFSGKPPGNWTSLGADHGRSPGIRDGTGGTSIKLFAWRRKREGYRA
jgi:hypothetical protein